MGNSTPVVVRNLSHSFAARPALDDVSFTVEPGEIFGLLGPNGSGKTTLFRILATLISADAGQATVFGFDSTAAAAAVRSRIGVVFQSPALDNQLTIRENLFYHGRLYGLHGLLLRRRVNEVLAGSNLAERAGDRVGILSGGLRRRADLARGLLHHPHLLILDEPSTGLDPNARRDLWQELDELRRSKGLTILLTTHLMEEGERCDRVGILDVGRLVALDRPGSLRAEIGGTVVTVQADAPEGFAKEIESHFQVQATVLDGAIRIEHEDGHTLVPRLAAAFPTRVHSVTVQVPTLEDVFVHRTGHRFRLQAEDVR